MTGSSEDDRSSSRRSAKSDRRAKSDGRTPPDRQRAWDYLLNVLSRQAYTVAELRTKLTRRKVPETLADELIARLVELRLVDDVSFAEQYVASRQDARGRLALRAELRRKGVGEEIVDERVGLLGDDQQLVAAVALLRKNAWRYRPAGDGAKRADGSHHVDGIVQDQANVDEHGARLRARKAQAKAKSFLARRGFTPDVVVAAVERVGWF